jgi:hypothetical protein
MANDETRTPTAWERFRAATRQVLSVSKEELEKREAAWKKKRSRRRRRPT